MHWSLYYRLLTLLQPYALASTGLYGHSLTLGAMGILFGLVPLLVYAVPAAYLGGTTPPALLGPVNPYLLLLFYSSSVRNPGSMPVGMGISWAVHVLVMASVAVLLMLGTILRLRSRALRLAFGAASVEGASGGKVRLKRRRDAEQQRALIPVDGPPLIWQGTLADRLRGKALRRVFYVLLALIAIGYGVDAARGSRIQDSASSTFLVFCATIASGLGLIAGLRTAAIAAGSVATEKEAKTLPILLTSHMSDREIIESKATAAIRRNFPLWIAVACMGCISALMKSSPSMLSRSSTTVYTQYDTWKDLFSAEQIASMFLSLIGIAFVLWAFHRGTLYGTKRKTNLIVITA